MRKKVPYRKILQIAVVAVMFVLFVLFIRKNTEYIRRMFVLDPAIIAGLICLSVVNRFIVGLKIKTFVKLFDIDLSFTEWFGSAAIMNFYNYFISKSGTALVAVYLKKNHGLNYTKCASLFMGDVLVGFFISGILGFTCSMYGMYSGVLKSFILPGCFLALTCVASVLLVMPDINLPERNVLFSKINNVLHGWNLLRKHVRTVIKLIILNLMIMLVFAFRYYIVFRLFSSEIPFFICLIIAPLSLVVQFASIIPGAYGLREAAAGFTTKLADMGFVPGAMATLMDRIIMMFVGFILGSIYSYLLLGRKKGDISEE